SLPPDPGASEVYLLQEGSTEQLKVSENEKDENPMEDMIWAMRYLIVEKLDWPRTRSEFLSVYADKYMRDLNACAERADGRGMSLLQLYEDFRNGDAQEPEERPGADELLRESRFQPISEKNFLDMYVVLSMYVYWLRIRSGSESISAVRL
ncbi:MAG: hypothetical protein LUF30_01690, partial [Lachnospiraceae bacterium]|nr:hypothetical protein [Lachnospiraceae bacterium]